MNSRDEKALLDSISALVKEVRNLQQRVEALEKRKPDVIGTVRSSGGLGVYDKERGWSKSGGCPRCGGAGEAHMGNPPCPVCGS